MSTILAVKASQCCCKAKSYGQKENLQMMAKMMIAVDIIALVGLITVAALVMRGKIALPNKVAYGMFGGAAAIVAIWGVASTVLACKKDKN